MTEFKVTNFIFIEKLRIKTGGFFFFLSDFFPLQKGPEAAARLTDQELLSARAFFFFSFFPFICVCHVPKVNHVLKSFAGSEVKSSKSDCRFWHKQTETKGCRWGFGSRNCLGLRSPRVKLLDHFGCAEFTVNLQ